MSSKYDNFKEPVLIVDDEEGIRLALEDIVLEMGLECRSAGTALEAFELFKNSPTPFMVLSDFRMPGKDGLWLCQEVRKTHPDLPFILITGYLDKEVAVQGIQAGATDVIEKPFRSDIVAKRIESIARERILAIEKEVAETAEITSLFVEESTSLFEDLENNILRLEERPLDPAIVDVLFRSVHSVKGGAGAIPGADDIARVGHVFESCLSQIKNGLLAPEPNMIEVFLTAADLMKDLLKALSKRWPTTSEQTTSINQTIQQLEDIKSGKSVAAKVKEAAKEVAGVPQSGKAEKKEAERDDGVYVTNDKMDSFMKISGELIVLKNYFQALNKDPEFQGLSSRAANKIQDFAHSMNKITDQLQDQIMSIRKVTLERALSKLPRIFRQVTKEVGKNVRLNTEGFGLGVDRTIANSLSTCLTHMLRNALDHGIESPQKRVDAGKPAEGIIRIHAKEEKGLISVLIEDDGAGIDPQRLIRKAIEKGLVDSSRAANFTPSEAYDLLFLPGFSTAEKVTGISGRGVGMDVVKSEIVNLQGKIRIESAMGKGTQFYIEIPVPKTVMVEQTVLVNSTGILMAVPLTAIAQLTTQNALKPSLLGRQLTCEFRGKTIPLVRYRDISSDSIEDSNPVSQADRAPVVVLQHKSDYVGLLVDSIHDQLEAVIRPFDRITISYPGFKGTTVLDDDQVAYVVAPDEIVNMGLGLNRMNAA